MTYTDKQGYVHETTNRLYKHNSLDPSDPRGGLYEGHSLLCNDALDLMMRKNEDYACKSDPYRNFRTFGTLGVLVRLSDKLSRLRSFEENNTFAVEDEKLVDTIQDAINYLVIYYQMKQEGK